MAAWCRVVRYDRICRSIAAGGEEASDVVTVGRWQSELLEDVDEGRVEGVVSCCPEVFPVAGSAGGDVISVGVILLTALALEACKEDPNRHA